MQEIQTSGKSLLKLVNELIAVAQTEAGAVAFAESHVDVVSLAATTMASVASEAGRKGILLQNLIEDGAPAIWADQRAMAQALGAILDNAIKFTDKEGLVTLEYSWRRMAIYVSSSAILDAVSKVKNWLRFSKPSNRLTKT